MRRKSLEPRGATAEFAAVHKVTREAHNFLVYLYNRWQDESEYEDIQDYAVALQGHLNAMYPECKLTVVKVLKRPFCFKVRYRDYPRTQDIMVSYDSRLGGVLVGSRCTPDKRITDDMTVGEILKMQRDDIKKWRKERKRQ